MSSATSNIRSALAKAFVDGAFFTSDKIAWENVAFTPPSATAWAKFTYVPSEPSAATLGTNGHDEVTGFVQIDLNFPDGLGDKPASDKYEAIRSLFKIGSRFTYGGYTVSVQSCGRSQGRNVDGYYRVAVTVFFNSRIQR